MRFVWMRAARFCSGRSNKAKEEPAADYLDRLLHREYNPNGSF